MALDMEMKRRMHCAVTGDAIPICQADDAPPASLQPKGMTQRRYRRSAFRRPDIAIAARVMVSNSADAHAIVQVDF